MKVLNKEQTLNYVLPHYHLSQVFLYKITPNLVDISFENITMSEMRLQLCFIDNTIDLDANSIELLKNDIQNRLAIKVCIFIKQISKEDFNNASYDIFKDVLFRRYKL